MKRALVSGLGPKGLIAALVLGFFVFLPVFVFPDQKDFWSTALLIAASLVYVGFAIAFDHSKLVFTFLQVACAVLLVVLSVSIGSTSIVILGLLGHAVWDAFHLATRQHYTPRWYAGACFYVDVAAAIFLLFR